MNHKSLHTWKPRLTADEERWATEAFRRMLLVYQMTLKATPETEVWRRTTIKTAIDQILEVVKSLQLDVDIPEEGDEEKTT